MCTPGDTNFVTRGGKRGQERPECPESCVEVRGSRGIPQSRCDTASPVSPTFTSSSYRGILCTGLIIRSDRACFSLFSRMLCCKTPEWDRYGPLRWDTAGTQPPTNPGSPILTWGHFLPHHLE